MNLGELIVEIREVLDDRDLEGYEQEDLLVPEARLIRLINQAQNDFCLRTGHVRDVIALNVVEDKLVYTLPDVVIRVMAGYKNGIQLAFKTTRTQWGCIPRDNEAFVGLSNQNAFVVDMDDERVIRFLTPLKEDDDVALRVWRRGVQLVELDDVPEIPEQYHHALVSYVCSRVYTGHDVDIGEKGAKQLHQADYVMAVQDARRELRLLENTTLSFAVGGV